MERFYDRKQLNEADSKIHPSWGWSHHRSLTTESWFGSDVKQIRRGNAFLHVYHWYTDHYIPSDISSLSYMMISSLICDISDDISSSNEHHIADHHHWSSLTIIRYQWWYINTKYTYDTSYDISSLNIWHIIYDTSLLYTKCPFFYILKTGIGSTTIATVIKIPSKAVHKTSHSDVSWWQD